MNRTMCMRRALLVPLIAMATACTPSLDSLTVTQGADVNLIQVEARIDRGAATSMQTPKVSIARVQEGQEPTFHDVGDMTLVNAPVYRRDAIQVPQGVIRVQVTVPYGVVFQSGTRELVRTRDFTVAAPDGCFFFDGADPGDFTADGFFEIVGPDPGTRRDICAGQSPLLSRGNNYPQPYTSVIPSQFGSRAVQTNTPCITAPPPTEKGFVNFDFVSPDLGGIPGWSGASGFELQARVPTAAPTPENQVRTQLIFEDGQGEFHAELDANDQRVFHNLTGGWQRLSMTGPGFQIARVRARMFVPANAGLNSPEARIEIDRVCPSGGS